MSDSAGARSPPPADDIHEAIRVAQGARTRPKIAITLVLCIALIVVTAGWLAGWFAPTPPLVRPQECAGLVSLTGAGASVVTPAMQAWTADYNTSVCAKVSYATAASGLSELASKSIEFAATDQQLNASQLAALGSGAIVLPVALEATAIVYNVPGLGSGLHLSGAVLAGIFLGTITNWNSSAIQALNPAVSFPPDLPITVVHCSGECTTTALLTGYLSEMNATWNETEGSGPNPAWPAGPGEVGSGALVATVKSTPGALGYSELPLAAAANLSWADVENPTGAFVAPSAANTTAAAAAANPNLPPETGVPSNQSILDEAGNATYPMATLSYVVVYQDLGVAYSGSMSKNTAQWLGDYILWVTTAGQTRGEAVGYAPLPTVLVTWNQDSLERLQYYGIAVLAGGDFDGGL